MKVNSTNKPFSWQEKGWDEFVAGFAHAQELSLISPLEARDLFSVIPYIFISIKDNFL